MKSTRLTLSILFIASAALFAVLALVVDGVEGRTITVDDDGGADYEKIQDAINASEDGDTVRVWEGEYSENVVVNKSVDFIGNGSETTTIDGGGSGDVVRITADWVNMSGFLVTGSGTDWQNPEAGIKIESSHNHIIENNCSNNYDGIFLRDSSDCKIGNNTCENNLYGIFLWDSSDCTIMNSTYSANSGSGIILWDSSDCTVKNNICSANNNNGIRLWNSSDCTIGNNTCEYNYHSGISLGDSNVCTIKNNACKNNSLCGIRLDDSSDCTINNNICSLNNNYGISLDYSPDCKISNNTCSSNSIYAIYFCRSSYCTITDNTCSNNLDGIHLWNSDDNTLDNNTCSNNRYGIILYSSSDWTFTNNTISENRVGIYLVHYSKENTAHYNNIYNNIEYGIDASDNSDYAINAINNWWGAASGPYHPTKNPDGIGDNVTDSVKFEFWLETDDINPPGQQENDDDDSDDFTILGLDGNIFIGLLGTLLLLALLSLFVFMGRSPRERRGKPPRRKMEKLGGGSGK